MGCTSCREAITENDRIGGIIIGGRKVRLELARNTSKIIITLPNPNLNFIEGRGNQPAYLFHQFYHVQTQLQNLFSSNYKSKVIPFPTENVFIIKLDSENNPKSVIEKLSRDHPDWTIQMKCDNNMGNSVDFSKSAQRQSGLFQLLIPETGVLPVSPSTLAKIHSNSPFLQYSVTPIDTKTTSTTSATTLTPYYFNSPLTFINQNTTSGMVRLYEDCHFSSSSSSSSSSSKIIREETFNDPNEAREAVLRLTPPLGDWEGDIFFGRLDNQKVTLKCLIERVTSYGKVIFVRLCNRSLIREDKVPVDSTAFVRFEDPQDAKNCLEIENGATWLGRIVKCEKCWNFMGKNTPPVSLVSKKDY